ncbi:MAG: AsmA family protein, partial [Rhodanobacteraceae bacterium]
RFGAIRLHPAEQTRNMRRRYRRLLIATVAAVIAIVALVPVAVIVFVDTFDWNRARPWIEQRAQSASGRRVEIDGSIDANWYWQRRARGKKIWSPGLAATARKVRVGNPDWAKRPQFATVESLRVDLALLPLLWHHLDVVSVQLVHPTVDFERRENGASTWTFDNAKGASGWRATFGDIEFGAGEVFVADATRDLALHATVVPLDAPIAFGRHVEGDDPSTRHDVIERVGRAAAQRLHKAARHRAERHGRRPAPPPYLFSWTARGTMAGNAVKGQGRIGGLLAMTHPEPFPLRADVEIGDTEIALTGTITDLTSPDAVDMRLWISGPNLALLYPIAGITLPQSRPYATVGRLAGRFHPSHSRLRYQDFTARVGGSDLAGTLSYRSGEHRPRLTGHVDSSLLQFGDLGTLVGAPADKSSGRNDTATDRVLPDEPFEVERWGTMDADVVFTGKRVLRNRELPISDVKTRIRMTSGVLTLDPFTFGMAGGSIRSSLRIDSNQKPPQARIALDLRKLQLSRLFEKTAGLSTSLGGVRGEVRLDGSGPAIAAILGASNGSVKLLMGNGAVSRTLMEEAGLNIIGTIASKIEGDRQIRIDCAAADFEARNGHATAKLFVFDTENALIDIDGSIDLGSERIDLTLHPETKGLRVMSLRSPLHVDGTFQHVDVSVDKKHLLTRAGGAIALGLLAEPLAALAPLIAPNNGEDDDSTQSCAPLIAELTGHGAAPDKTTRPASDARR